MPGVIEIYSSDEDAAPAPPPLPAARKKASAGESTASRKQNQPEAALGKRIDTFYAARDTNNASSDLMMGAGECPICGRKGMSMAELKFHVNSCIDKNGAAENESLVQNVRAVSGEVAFPSLLRPAVTLHDACRQAAGDEGVASKVPGRKIPASRRGGGLKLKKKRAPTTSGQDRTPPRVSTVTGQGDRAPPRPATTGGARELGSPDGGIISSPDLVDTGAGGSGGGPARRKRSRVLGSPQASPAGLGTMQRLVSGEGGQDSWTRPFKVREESEAPENWREVLQTQLAFLGLSGGGPTITTTGGGASQGEQGSGGASSAPAVWPSGAQSLQTLCSRPRPFPAPTKAKALETMMPVPMTLSPDGSSDEDDEDDESAAQQSLARQKRRLEEAWLLTASARLRARYSFVALRPFPGAPPPSFESLRLARQESDRLDAALAQEESAAQAFLAPPFSQNSPTVPAVSVAPGAPDAPTAPAISTIPPIPSVTAAASHPASERRSHSCSEARHGSGWSAKTSIPAPQGNRSLSSRVPPASSEQRSPDKQHPPSQQPMPSGGGGNQRRRQQQQEQPRQQQQEEDGQQEQLRQQRQRRQQPQEEEQQEQQRRQDQPGQRISQEQEVPGPLPLPSSPQPPSPPPRPEQPREHFVHEGLAQRGFVEVVKEGGATLRDDMRMDGSEKLGHIQAGVRVPFTEAVRWIPDPNHAQLVPVVRYRVSFAQPDGTLIGWISDRGRNRERPMQIARLVPDLETTAPAPSPAPVRDMQTLESVPRGPQAYPQGSHAPRRETQEQRGPSIGAGAHIQQSVPAQPPRQPYAPHNQSRPAVPGGQPSYPRPQYPLQPQPSTADWEREERIRRAKLKQAEFKRHRELQQQPMQNVQRSHQRSNQTNWSRQYQSQHPEQQQQHPTHQNAQHRPVQPQHATRTAEVGRFGLTCPGCGDTFTQLCCLTLPEQDIHVNGCMGL